MISFRQLGSTLFTLGLAGTLWGCGGGQTPEVNGVAAEQRQLQEMVMTNGVVEPIEHAEVRARLSGRILEIPDPGVSARGPTTS